jgi:hypothetical protein
MAQATFLDIHFRRNFFHLLNYVCPISVCDVKTPAASIDSTAEGKIEGVAEKRTAVPQKDTQTDLVGIFPNKT